MRPSLYISRDYPTGWLAPPASPLSVASLQVSQRRTAPRKTPRMGINLSAECFPFASQLIPNKQNLAYLINSTILTRFMTSILRVTVDHPRFNPNPEATPSEKMNTFLERMFVEFIGTGSTLLSLQLSMDFASKAIQHMQMFNPKWQIHRPAHILNQLPKTVSKTQKDKIQKALESALGTTSQKLMFNVLFKQGHLQQVTQHLEKQGLKPAHIQLISGRSLEEGLERQFFHLNLLAKGVLIVGALGNALWGGFGVQLLNDKFVAPILVPKVKALFGVKPSLSPPSMFSNTTPPTPSQPAPPYTSTTEVPAPLLKEGGKATS